MATATSTLAEGLALSLKTAMEHRHSRSARRREEQIERQRELDVLLAKVRDLEQLRKHRDELAAAKRDLDDEIEILKRKISAREDEVASLEASLKQMLESLQQRCLRAVAGLPLLASQGMTTWIRWLERWHADHQRPFEEADDWARYLIERNIAKNAIEELLKPILDEIDQLELSTGEDGLRRIDLHCKVQEAEQEANRLEEAIRRMLERVGDRYGRILKDIPDPKLQDSRELLCCYEGLLRYLEGLLGRFAAAARIESVTLEALS